MISSAQTSRRSRPYLSSRRAASSATGPRPADQDHRSHNQRAASQDHERAHGVPPPALPADAAATERQAPRRRRARRAGHVATRPSAAGRRAANASSTNIVSSSPCAIEGGPGERRVMAPKSGGEGASRTRLSGVSRLAVMASQRWPAPPQHDHDGRGTAAIGEHDGDAQESGKDPGHGVLSRLVGGRSNVTR